MVSDCHVIDLLSTNDKQLVHIALNRLFYGLIQRVT
jgi:hypothetical protein